MKALLKKASDWNYYKNIEINNLSELLKIHNSLIVETDELTLDLYKHSDNDTYNKDFEIVITIYDDWVE